MSPRSPRQSQAACSKSCDDGHVACEPDYLVEIVTKTTAKMPKATGAQILAKFDLPKNLAITFGR